MPPTSSLPTELWIPILQYATYHPQLPIIEYIPFSRDYAEDIFQARHTFNLAVKRSVVLVCKTWYSLAIPMLWETVHVNSLAKAAQVFLCLQNSEKSTAITPQSAFGLLVRHLYASHTSSIGTLRSEKLVQLVCRIVEHCPCLEILCHAGPRPIVSQSIRAFSHLAGNRLGKLDLGRTDVCMDMLTWELLAGCLSRFTCLRTLVLPLRDMDPRRLLEFPSDVTSKLRSTTLQTLVLPPGTYALLLSDPDRWDFPNLEDLHLSHTLQVLGGTALGLSHVLSTVQDAAPDAEADTLRRRVRSLDLLGLESYTPPELHTLFALLTHFPALCALRVQLVTIAVPPALPAHFTLQHVAVDWDCAEFAAYVARAQPLVLARACAEHVGRTLDVLLAAELPALRVVRVCGRALGLLQAESEVVVGWRARLRERGIEFRWG